MRRILGITATLAVLGTVTIAWRAGPSSSNPFDGAWVATSWVVDGSAIEQAQPGLIIFTGTHYSMMYANSVDPRAQYGDEGMTDAEIIAAYRSFTANSGRYEVNGNQLTTRAYVAKDPNYMGGWPENAETYTFRFEGETLHMEWPSDWPEARSGTFRRVEGQPAPW